MTDISPPGGLPCHPNELMHDTDWGSEIIVKTGLLGVGTVLLCIIFSLIALVVSSPFLLLGLAEVVAARPNHYRVRWIRRETS